MLTNRGLLPLSTLRCSLGNASAALLVVDALEKQWRLKYFLLRVAGTTGERFVFIIDEWDAQCRMYSDKPQAMDRYVDWLRRMFKDATAIQAIAGVYMTGILPIKKYKTQSALNNFKEYSMVTPGAMARHFGFTKEEVKVLAERHCMDFNMLEMWYDGYQIGAEMSMFNPNSVMEAISNEWCENYWSKTGAFDAVTEYIGMNYEGLKDDIIGLLAGERCVVNSTGFNRRRLAPYFAPVVLKESVVPFFLPRDLAKDIPVPR